MHLFAHNSRIKSGFSEAVEEVRGVANLRQKMGNAFAQCFQKIEEFMFPKSPFLEEHNNQYSNTNKGPAPNSKSKNKGGVLLAGCETVTEHYERIKTLLESARDHHGSIGLQKLGLEYRIVHCDEHKVIPVVTEHGCDDDEFRIVIDDDEGSCYEIAIQEDLHDNNADEEFVRREAAFQAMTALRLKNVEKGGIAESVQSYNGSNVSNSNNNNYFCDESHHAEMGTTASLTVRAMEGVDDDDDGFLAALSTPCRTSLMFCHLCKRHLFHIETNTRLHDDNRKEFIADGDMYEAASALAQEVAQEIMMEEGRMEWVTVENAKDENTEPIRVLMSSDHPLITNSVNNTKGTVLICTGRGKVRGGIFSRQHLLCSGLETATAVPLVRDAVVRSMNVVIFDPNAHGEASGFITFQKSMDFLEAGYWNDASCQVYCETGAKPIVLGRDIFTVFHSASGGHMVRYFLPKPECTLLQYIQATAFTDSTHSIQWANGDDKKRLRDMLEGEKSVYFRCARAGDGIAGDGNKWYLHPAGQTVQADTFWRHRFGSIKTMWAGTNDHSLIIWYSQAKIWEHFDHFLGGRKSNGRTQ